MRFQCAGKVALLLKPLQMDIDEALFDMPDQAQCLSAHQGLVDFIGVHGALVDKAQQCVLNRERKLHHRTHGNQLRKWVLGR